MLRIRSFILLLAAICLTGCSSVSTTHLLGEPIDDSTAEEFDGVWKAGDTLFMARHLGGGEFRVATSKWNELEKKFEFEQNRLFVRSLGKAMIMQLPEGDEDSGDGGEEKAVQYSLARAILTETDELILIPADARRFAPAVQNGELKGEAFGAGAGEGVEGFAQGSATTVHLTGAKEEIDAFLTADRLLLFFNIEDGGVLRRVEEVKIE